MTDLFEERPGSNELEGQGEQVEHEELAQLDATWTMRTVLVRVPRTQNKRKNKKWQQNTRYANNAKREGSAAERTRPREEPPLAPPTSTLVADADPAY